MQSSIAVFTTCAVASSYTEGRGVVTAVLANVNAAFCFAWLRMQLTAQVWRASGNAKGITDTGVNFVVHGKAFTVSRLEAIVCAWLSHSLQLQGLEWTRTSLQCRGRW